MRKWQDLFNICLTILKECLAIKAKEICALVTDFADSALDAAFYEAILAHDAVPIFIRVPPESHIQYSNLLEKAITSASVVIIHTQDIFPYALRKKVATSGGRVLSLCAVTDEIARRALAVDYPRLAKTTRAIAQLLAISKEMFISTPAGTELSLSINNQIVICLDGLATEAGMITALPAGVVATVPLGNAAEGTIVLDGSVSSLGLIKDPIVITVKEGRITKIEGGETAQKLEAILNRADLNARCLAEVGIGTNPKAIYTGLLIEDERVCGSAHVGFGRNVHLGGNIESNFHIDATLKSPTVYADQLLLVDKGSLLYPKCP